MILGLFPELGGFGGVQEAGRQVAAAVAQWSMTRGFEFRFLALNDKSGRNSFSIRGHEFAYEGFGRAKAKFVATAIANGMLTKGAALALHPNLGPLAAVLRPAVVFAWGIEVWQPLGRIRGQALRKARLVCTPSLYTARRLIDLQHIPEERVRVLPLAVPEGSPRSQPRLFPAGHVVLTVSRLDPSEGYKGVDTLIKALPDVIRAIPDAALAIVGEGENRAKLQTLARTHEVEERIRFLGAVSQEELAGCYQSCEVFALPSAGEGFGFVHLEAMAAGKPVIGGKHGATPEVVKDGTTGFLVRHGDAEELGTALIRLLADASLRREMGARARQHAEMEYSSERFEGRLGAILDEVLVP